jgi:HSP20 family protein
MVNMIRRDQNDRAGLGRLFNDFFGEAPFAMTRPMEEFSFPLDVCEDEKNLVVRASLPGFSQDDIDIQVQNGILTISAHKEESHEDTGERFLRRERRSGSVVRQIALPEIVDEENASAELADGILTLRLPKTPEAMPRKIQVRGGAAGARQDATTPRTGGEGNARGSSGSASRNTAGSR